MEAGNYSSEFLYMHSYSASEVMTVWRCISSNNNNIIIINFWMPSMTPTRTALKAEDKCRLRFNNIQCVSWRMSLEVAEGFLVEISEWIEPLGLGRQRVTFESQIRGVFWIRITTRITRSPHCSLLFFWQRYALCNKCPSNLTDCHVHFHSIEVARFLFARWRVWAHWTRAVFVLHFLLFYVLSYFVIKLIKYNDWSFPSLGRKWTLHRVERETRHVTRVFFV